MRERSKLPASTIKVCTDEIKGTDRSGRAYCRLFEKCICFQNLADLLLKADRLFDEAGYPQAYHQSRTFGRSSPRKTIYIPRLYSDEIYMQQQEGKIVTEYIIVQSRRQSGWQGVYIDSSGKSTEFVSEIELLKCMNF